MNDRISAQRAAESLEEPVSEAANLARKLGLDPYRVNYWIVDYDEMNELIAYDGFQTRYPHWRWGMKYDRQQKQNQFLGGKAFEIVNNDDPAHAFLQESNSLADQKAVITHVEAHADFFAHNQWFGLFTGGGTPDAAAMLARHADAIAAFMRDPDIEREAVESWIDTIQCLETNIDRHRAFESASAEDAPRIEDDDIADRLDELDLGADVVSEVFDDDWLEAQREDEPSGAIPPEPEPDLLAFLFRHGMAYDEEREKAVEMEEWQRTVLELLRREAYYFAAQRMTKVMNEGWAAYWESMMMGEENFAGTDEFLSYADHQARVLASRGSIHISSARSSGSTSRTRSTVARSASASFGWRESRGATSTTWSISRPSRRRSRPIPSSIGSRAMGSRRSIPTTRASTARRSRPRETARSMSIAIPGNCSPTRGWPSATTRSPNPRTAGSSSGQVARNSNGSRDTCSTIRGTATSMRRSPTSSTRRAGTACSRSARATTT